MKQLTYDQKAIEKKWQQQWQEMKIHHFDIASSKPVFSIDVPPRYASGPLHAGHAVHYTHIDFSARYKRLRGYNVFFPLCFDVNGIPIEERVERQLNITRKDIDRHKFTKLCSEFANKNIKTMTDQFTILGESMDPTIYYQTDAEYYRRITQISFLKLYDNNLIYKGKFPVNWCPRCMTAMADAEITYKKNITNLNTIKFYFSNTQSGQLLKYQGIGKDKEGMYIKIATTRPEMLPSCQIIAVHPSDERAAWLVGQEVVVPLFKKKVKIVEDEAVDPEFGTGIVMICTIGDKEDLNWVFKYKLPLELSVNEEGKMTDICKKYAGMTVIEARAAVITDMKQKSLLIHQEPLDQNVGVCWRCKTPVEFINAKQWFLKTVDFKHLVLEKSNEMAWYPEFMKIRLEEWVNSLEWDWVISRQRYFATPIPLWECKTCEEVVVARPEDCYIDPTKDKPPIETCPSCGGSLKGCEDVFDTWMDSSISPLYNTFWQRDDEKFKKLYPMTVRAQSHDIIRTWAFYTILRCTLLTDRKPFENVMMGGFILSEDGTPMHASLGNVIDPLAIINEFSTDAFRCYAASCSLGEDNAFRKKDVIRGQKLLRKLWNVEQFISHNIDTTYKPHQPTLTMMDTWILSKYSTLIERCTHLMDAYDFSQSLKEIEYFLWHELADHYIEMAKAYIFKRKDCDSVHYTLYTIGLGMLQLFSPFFPHITEELYQYMFKKTMGYESIHISEWPGPIPSDSEAVSAGECVKNYIATVRRYKSEHGLPLNAALPSTATYADAEIINALKKNAFVVKTTLNLPESHEFIVGKPLITEKITEIIPAYAILGPLLKQHAKTIINYIKNNQDDLKTIIEETGDLTWDAFPKMPVDNPSESLLKNNLVTVKKELQIIGKKDKSIIQFDNMYLEISSETRQ